LLRITVSTFAGRRANRHLPGNTRTCVPLAVPVRRVVEWPEPPTLRRRTKVAGLEADNSISAKIREAFPNSPCLWERSHGYRENPSIPCCCRVVHLLDLTHERSSHLPSANPFPVHTWDSETLLATSTAQDTRHRHAYRQTRNETPATFQNTVDKLPAINDQ